MMLYLFICLHWHCFRLFCTLFYAGQYLCNMQSPGYLLLYRDLYGLPFPCIFSHSTAAANSVHRGSPIGLSNGSDEFWRSTRSSCRRSRGRCDQTLRIWLPLRLVPGPKASHSSAPTWGYWMMSPSSLTPPAVYCHRAMLSLQTQSPGKIHHSRIPL